jgi:transposase
MLERVDLQPMFDAYQRGGKKPHRPDLMLAIALVEILDGRSSPAKWHKDATTRDHCKYVGQGIAPSRSSWYEFRDRCDKFIQDIADQIVRAAINDKIVDPTQASLDGTFTRAAATRHRLFNHGQIQRRVERLQGAIAILDEPTVQLDPEVIEMLRNAHEIPCWIGNTPTGRQRQLEQFIKAESALAARIAANAERPKRYRRDPAKMILSVWDVDAVVGRDKEKVLCPLYNTQFMVACGSDVILSYGVFAQCTDSGTLSPMIDRTQAVTDEHLKKVFADAAYCSLLDLQDCIERRIELYAPVIGTEGASPHKAADGEPLLSQKEFAFFPDEQRCQCPAGHEMPLRARSEKPRADGRSVIEMRYEQASELCAACPLASRCLKAGSTRRSVARLEGQELLDAQATKMSTKEGKANARLRGQTVERIFADGKLHRNQNRQNGRGLARVKAEVGLLVVAINTLRTYNLRLAREKPNE